MESYIKSEITDACQNHSFVGIVCDDGHEHTVQAFNQICGTVDGDKLENQLDYCIAIAKGFDVEILTADSVEEAVEEDILIDNGEDVAMITRYTIK